MSETDEEIDFKTEVENQEMAQEVKKNNRVIIKQVNGKIPKTSYNDK